MRRGMRFGDLDGVGGGGESGPEKMRLCNLGTKPIQPLDKKAFNGPTRMRE
jgi:hypothetical protein